MIKQFLLRLFLAGLFLFLFSLKLTDISIGERIYEHPLETAWKTSGIKLQSVTTESWMKLNERWLTTYELRELANNIKDKLGVETNTDLINGEQGESNYVSFEGIQSDNTIVIVTIQSRRNNYFNETQLGLYTVNNSNLNNLRHYLNILRNSLVNVGNINTSNFKISLAGEYYGKLDESLVKELSGKIFRKLEAQQVDLLLNPEGNIVRGYSELLNSVNTARKGSHNVELTTIYDSTRKVTEVVLASPDC